MIPPPSIQFLQDDVSSYGLFDCHRGDAGTRAIQINLVILKSCRGMIRLWAERMPWLVWKMSCSVNLSTVALGLASLPAGADMALNGFGLLFLELLGGPGFL